MATTPGTRIGKIDLYEAHLQTWADNAPAIDPGDNTAEFRLAS